MHGLSLWFQGGIAQLNTNFTKELAEAQADLEMTRQKVERELKGQDWFVWLLECIKIMPVTKTAWFTIACMYKSTPKNTGVIKLSAWVENIYKSVDQFLKHNYQIHEEWLVLMMLVREGSQRHWCLPAVQWCNGDTYWIFSYITAGLLSLALLCNLKRESQSKFVK